MNTINILGLTQVINQTNTGRAVWLDNNVLSINGRVVRFENNGLTRIESVAFRCKGPRHLLKELSESDIIHLSDNETENILAEYRRIKNNDNCSTIKQN